MPRAISRTALSMALFRAIETASPDRLVDDPFAIRFLPPAFRSIALLAKSRSLRRIIEGLLDWCYPGARSSGVGRTRLIDDWLIAAAGDVEQVLALGAGFDTRYLRLGRNALHPTAVFELDRPSVLRSKHDALKSVQTPPTNHTAVEIDFLRERIADRLLQSGFRPDQTNLIVWEGVTHYLNLAAITDVFESIARLSKPGSTIIFTYVHKGVLDGSFETTGLDRLRRRLNRWREPWIFGWHPEELPAWLAKHGYELTDDLGATEYRQAYYGPKAKRFAGYEFYRVARATLTDTIQNWRAPNAPGRR